MRITRIGETIGFRPTDVQREAVEAIVEALRFMARHIQVDDFPAPFPDSTDLRDWVGEYLSPNTKLATRHEDYQEPGSADLHRRYFLCVNPTS